jgi:hydroxymethylbilane synthase
VCRANILCRVASVFVHNNTIAKINKVVYPRALSATFASNSPPLLDFSHIPMPQPKPPTLIRLATRESPLAMAQTEWVAAALLRQFPSLRVEIIGMTTKGDQILDKPLAQIGGKGLFIKELEVAIEEGRADIAVHSMKDVPMVMPAGFSLATVGAREDVADAFVSSRYASLAELPAGAVVGTSSLRRESQIRHFYPELRVLPLRGNVNTRLRKLDDDEYDAIILASAGLKRLGLAARIRATLDTAKFIPAVAQGALGIEYRTGEAAIADMLAGFAITATNASIAAERAFGRRLSASCDVPLGAHAAVTNSALSIRGFVATPDGKTRIADEVHGELAAAEALGVALAERLIAGGADRILASLSAATARAG